MSKAIVATSGKSQGENHTAAPKPTSSVEKTRLENLRATEAQEALDKAAADQHPRKGDIDRPGFDLGGMDGEPIDAGLRDVEPPDRT